LSPVESDEIEYLVIMLKRLQEMKILHLVLVFCLIVLVACSNQNQSASLKRFQTVHKSKWSNNKPEISDIDFSFFEITGIAYEDSVIRRDPSDIIKIDGKYHVWYGKSCTRGPVCVGIKKATNVLRAYPWDLSEIWMATSADGLNWKEECCAIKRGAIGTFDARSVFTPNICVANGKYYLYYQAASDLTDVDDQDFKWTRIGMAWSETPYGPWNKISDPILIPGRYGNPGNYPKGPIVEKGDWDALVCQDPNVVELKGKFYLYYRSCYFRGSHNRFEMGNLKEWVENDNGIPMGWGVAIAEQPEGPFVKSELNPVIIGGNECVIWPYNKGVCAMVAEGPEMNTIQFSKDGVNFKPFKTVQQVPFSTGLYRPDFSDETGNNDAITWGLYHVIWGTKWHYLKKFVLSKDLLE